MLQVNYQDIVLNKFHFIHLNLDKEFEELIWGLSYPDTGVEDGEVQYKIPKADSNVRKAIVDTLCSVKLDSTVEDFVRSFNFDINKMKLGEWIPLHNEEAQLSPFEVILWLTKTDDYEGREFYMVDNGTESKIKPVNGMVCFLDTTAPNVYHGVTPLKTDTEIISIVGGLGRKNGYSKRD